MLKERQEFVTKTRREADEILEAARVRAERMVQRTEVVRAAEQRARQVMEAAETDSRRLRHETEDFLDQRLGSFEILLDKLQKPWGRSAAALDRRAPPTGEERSRRPRASSTRTIEPMAGPRCSSTGGIAACSGHTVSSSRLVPPADVGADLAGDRGRHGRGGRARVDDRRHRASGSLCASGRGMPSLSASAGRDREIDVEERYADEPGQGEAAPSCGARSISADGPRGGPARGRRGPAVPAGLPRPVRGLRPGTSEGPCDATTRRPTSGGRCSTSSRRRLTGTSR